ncbi:allantoate amidohydrolase [Aeromicrobium sp.]|uniref:allantoate amidohydrolase n=1 Tax=Aeromicrobium sp. TaxID=1871063 RepID=UPI0028B0A8FF|nr:allantoate amidohydrolase [Aeromicrobium sp.]
MLDAIAGIGRDGRTGGYRRFAWSDADMALREWFAGEAASRGMDVVEDGNGNQLAWWGHGSDAVLIGSHLDSVPDGGAFDGPLGVVSSFAAIDRLRAQGASPARPVVVGNFADEEGARFGIACAGSQLAAGRLSADRALAQTDLDGRTMAEVMVARGRDPRTVGPAGWLADIGTFVELHVEQGRSLVHSGDAVGVATAIWPHGRWRLDFCGEANHAGATLMSDRRDPMLAYAATALAARDVAVEAAARATFGRLSVDPGGTNAIASRVTAWLDARATDEDQLTTLVDRIASVAREAADSDGVTVEVAAESVSTAVEFDVPLRNRLAAVLDAPLLPTAAGHDAGVLSALVPTAMLFVRNPTGVSHSPHEWAEDADCDAGVDALVTVLRELA